MPASHPAGQPAAQTSGLQRCPLAGLQRSRPPGLRPSRRVVIMSHYAMGSFVQGSMTCLLIELICLSCRRMAV